MAGKLPKKQKKNLGRSHFPTLDEYIAADPNNWGRRAKAVVKINPYDNRLYRRAKADERARRHRELERLFESHSHNSKKRKPSKCRSLATHGYMIEPPAVRWVA
jgi:hypothetical protein